MRGNFFLFMWGHRKKLECSKSWFYFRLAKCTKKWQGEPLNYKQLKRPNDFFFLAFFLDWWEMEKIHNFYTVFSWGEFKGMENIGRKMLKKIVVSTVWQAEENRKGGKPGRKLSLPSPQISSSQIGRKSLERKCPHSTFTIIPRSGIK